MGYTHYWDHPAFADDEWKELTTSARKIIRIAEDFFDIPLSEDYDTLRAPIVDSKYICFNGYGDEGHETFQIRKKGDNAFCKTARKPYDAAVVACLIEAARINPEFNWSSDGDGEEDQQADARKILDHEEFNLEEA